MEELLRASLLEFSCRKIVKQMNYLLVPAAKSTKQSKAKQNSPPLKSVRLLSILLQYSGMHSGSYGLGEITVRYMQSTLEEYSDNILLTEWKCICETADTSQCYC